jgi:hypothetical protein
VTTPRQRIESECRRVGRDAFARSCGSVLEGELPSRGLLGVLAGTSHHALQADPGRDDDYWLRVWAARGLLWGWDDVALPALLQATSDEAWRVREMAAKVVARHTVDEALDAVLPLLADPVPRVRAAAARALAAITGRQ